MHLSRYLLHSYKTTVTYVSEKAHVSYTHYNQMNMPVFNNKSRNNNTFLEARIAYRKKRTLAGEILCQMFCYSCAHSACLFISYFFILFFLLLFLFQSRFAIYQRLWPRFLFLTCYSIKWRFRSPPFLHCIHDFKK